MSFSVLNVLSLLLSEFQSYGPVPKTPVNPSRMERKLAIHLKNLVEEAESDEVEIEEKEELAYNDDEDYEEFEFDVNDDFKYPTDLKVSFGNQFVTKEEVQKAIKHFRSSKRKSRPLKSMNARFKWIKTEYDLTKLRKIEACGDNFYGDRLQRLRVLGLKLFELVKGKIEQGVSLHDADLRRLAITLNKSDYHLDDFIASDSWILRWKKKYRIVSRKITKFTTRKCIVDRAEVEKNGNEFLKAFKEEMKDYHPYQIFNADQTGIRKELYGARALSFQGEKDTVRVAQAQASLTHRYTFLPMIFANGTMGPKAFMVLPESTGQFPPTRPIPTTPNLVVIAGKSHMMTKQMKCEWLKECVFHPDVPKKLLMLVDSWPAFRDHRTIQSLAPPGFEIEVRNIPPLCTSFVQPLDVYWNLPWKALIKRFITYSLIHRPDYIIAQRNNLILMISTLYHQISAKDFQDFHKYSWKSAGYIDEYNPFLSPVQACFDEVKEEDCYLFSCSTPAFIKCRRCKEFICFEHFLVETPHYCPFL